MKQKSLGDHYAQHAHEKGIRDLHDLAFTHYLLEGRPGDAIAQYRAAQASRQTVTRPESEHEAIDLATFRATRRRQPPPEAVSTPALEAMKRHGDALAKACRALATNKLVVNPVKEVAAIVRYDKPRPWTADSQALSLLQFVANEEFDHAATRAREHANELRIAHRLRAKNTPVTPDSVRGEATAEELTDRHEAETRLLRMLADRELRKQGVPPEDARLIAERLQHHLDDLRIALLQRHEAKRPRPKDTD